MENTTLLNKVTAVMQTAEGIETIEGYVTSTYIDDFGNVACRLMTAEGARNVQIACINASRETSNKYKALCKEVKRITTLGNSKVKAVVEEHNAMIKVLEAEFNGGSMYIPEEMSAWVEEQKKIAQGEQQAI